MPLSRFPFVRTSAACALTMGLLGLGATPALALQSDTFAEPGPLSNAVVSVRTADADPAGGVCTGTAVAPHWVITARHCMDHLPEAGGSVRVGQGEEQRELAVDRWLKAPQGDIALLHTSEDIGLDTYPKVATEAPAAGAPAKFFGWSSDGSGGTTKLPAAEAKVDGPTPLVLFDAASGIEATLEGDAQTQQGDSGAGLFVNDEVAGILSAGLFMDPENPNPENESESPKAAYALVAPQAAWIAAQFDATAESNSDEGQSQGLLLGVGVAVLVCAAVVTVLVRRKSAGSSRAV